MPRRPPGEIDRIIGQRIRQRRKELGASQSDLGIAIGVSYQQIQKYEAGKGSISVARLVEIANQLQVPVANILDGFSCGR